MPRTCSRLVKALTMPQLTSNHSLVGRFDLTALVLGAGRRAEDSRHGNGRHAGEQRGGLRPIPRADSPSLALCPAPLPNLASRESKHHILDPASPRTRPGRHKKPLSIVHTVVMKQPNEADVCCCACTYAPSFRLWLPRSRQRQEAASTCSSTR